MSVAERDDPHRQFRFIVAFAAVLMLAACFRLFGLNWDNGHYFHPDERFIATVMDGRLSVPGPDEWRLLLNPEESPLNTRSDGEDGTPRDFAYGSLPFIVATFIGSTLSLPLDFDLTSYQHVGLFGRFLTVLIDLGTVAMVMLFARRAFGELAAIIAGVLTAGSVVLIQLAHFFTVDAWVTFFSIAALYACLHVIRDFSLRWSLAAAALGGAALATKASVGVLGLPILLSLAIGALAVSADRREAAGRFAGRLATCAVPAIAVFALFEPYAIWRPATYLDDLRRQWEIVNGHADVPFTRQFVGTTAGITEIQDLLLWGIAPGFGIAALVATAIGLYWCVRDRDPRYLLLLSWIVPYFALIASSEARFLRYAAPLVPPLAIVVGHQLSMWWANGQAGVAGRRVAGTAITAVVGITLLWALAFMTVYAGQHPRVEASEWIYENVEPGSTLTSEVWDDALPVRLESTGQPSYEQLEMALYAGRPPEDAFDYIADTLDEADYIILSSQRLSHSIPRLPWRYPVESAYYRLLHDEKLGYELAHEATSYPGFGPVRVNTLAADESFSVYDHPPVWIFRKVRDLPREELELRFAYALNQPWLAERDPPEPTLRLGEPVSRQPAAGDVGWSSAITGSHLVATAVWMITVALLGLAVLPLTVRLFPRFADGGLGFSPLIGLLGAGVLTWLAWSLGIVGFSAWTILASVLIVGAVSWFGSRLPGNWRKLLATRRTPVLIGLGVFLVTFVIFLLLRAANPDLWHPAYGGERPMETAYITAIARSEAFPPYDPWFADGYINYYYYGFFLTAALAKLTGIQIEIAFQLMLATLAGLLAAGAFSLGSTLSGSMLQTRKPRWLVSGGLLTVFLVVFAGNLDAIRQVIRNRSLEVDFWSSSRVVDFAINEFPYFSFLYGDLHPHLIAAPMLVLVLALTATWVQECWRTSRAWVALWAVVTTIAIGSLTVTNLWDGPTAGVIVAAGLLLPTLRRSRTPWQRLARAVVLIPIIAAGSLLLFSPFYTRYASQTGGIARNETGTGPEEWLIHFGGLAIVLVAVFLLALGRMLNTNPFSSRLLVYGAMLATTGFVAGSVIGWGLHDSGSLFVMSGAAVALGGGVIAQAPSAIRTIRDRTVALLIVSPFIAGAGVMAWERPVGAIASLLVAAFLILYLTNQQRDAVLIGSIAGAAGSGLILVADLVHVEDHLAGSDWERMNTVFKLYFQAWTLLAIAAGTTGIWFIAQARKRFRSRGSALPGANIVTRFGARAAVVAGPVLVLALLAYPFLATPDRLATDMESSPAGLSLNGFAWMDGGMIQNQAGDIISFTGDREAVDWLRHNVDGNEIVLEAAIGPYRGGGSRISSATGLPAVLGWNSHQSQQRADPSVAERSADVRETYNTEDLERKHYLLRQYNVGFVIVGDVERFTLMSDPEQGDDPDYYASESGLNAFDELVGDGLEIAFESEGTTVYRVTEFAETGQVP